MIQPPISKYNYGDFTTVMTKFEPFDDNHAYDSQALNKGFPDYMLQSILPWIIGVFQNRGLTSSWAGVTSINGDEVINPMSRHLRKTFRRSWPDFSKDILADVSTLTNVLSYILQNNALVNEGRDLESILQTTGSAYAVEVIETKIDQYRTNYKMKLIHRVSKVVVEQAEEVLTNSELMKQAWDEHYSLQSDDEKTVTRATDALTGLLRDKYFPDEKRPMFGSILQTIRKNPKKYPLPAETIFDREKLLDMMLEFSKIRGNHKTGTGRAPTHEEAGFVLHFSIMMFQLISVK